MGQHQPGRRGRARWQQPGHFATRLPAPQVAQAHHIPALKLQAPAIQHLHAVVLQCLAQCLCQRWPGRPGIVVAQHAPHRVAQPGKRLQQRMQVARRVVRPVASHHHGIHVQRIEPVDQPLNLPAPHEQARMHIGHQRQPQRRQLCGRLQVQPVFAHGQQARLHQAAVAHQSQRSQPRQPQHAAPRRLAQAQQRGATPGNHRPHGPEDPELEQHDTFAPGIDPASFPIQPGQHHRQQQPCPAHACQRATHLRGAGSKGRRKRGSIHRGLSLHQ